MKKSLLLLFSALLITPFSANSYEKNEIELCSSLGAFAGSIAKDIYQRKLKPTESKTYKEIEFLDNNNLEIRKRMLHLIDAGGAKMSHELRMAFFTHACLNNYTDDYKTVSFLAPILTNKCNTSSDMAICINNALEDINKKLVRN